MEERGEIKEKKIPERRYKAELGIKDFFKYYREKSKYPVSVKNNKLPELVEFSLYRKILNDYFLELVSIMFSNSRAYLPCNLGYLFIAKKKLQYLSSKGKPCLSVNWAESKRLGKKVHLFNEDRDGYVYRFFWNKGPHHKGINWYKFVVSRKNKRNLAKVLKQDKSTDFFELETHRGKQVK